MRFSYFFPSHRLQKMTPRHRWCHVTIHFLSRSQKKTQIQSIMNKLGHATQCQLYCPWITESTWKDIMGNRWLTGLEAVDWRQESGRRRADKSEMQETETNQVTRIKLGPTGNQHNWRNRKLQTQYLMVVTALPSEPPSELMYIHKPHKPAT